VNVPRQAADSCRRGRLARFLSVAVVAVGLFVASGPVNAADAAVVFDGSPGSGAPPATLGGYQMTPFPSDTRPIETLVSDIPAPGGSVALSSAVHVLSVPEFWATGPWAGGTYSGTVYWTGSNQASVTMTLPAHVKALYFYASPFACGTFLMQATAQDGTTSGPTPVTTTCGFGAEPNAGYFGFYATGSDELTIVTIALVDSSTIYQSFGVGDLALAYAPAPSPVQMLADLRVASTGVGTGTSLADKVALAQSRFSAQDVPGTCSVLADFVSQVNAQAGKKISRAQAASLTGSAREVMAVIGC
jgi:hypothetical protein